MVQERNLNFYFYLSSSMIVRRIIIKSFKITLLLLFLYSLQSCCGGNDDYNIIDLSEQNGDTNKPDNSDEQGEVKNDSSHTKTLKILAIGNSFTEDGTAYLPSLIKKSGIEDVIIGKMVVGGTSLQYHYTHATNNDSVYAFSVSTENGFKSQGKTNFSSCLLYDTWDIIIMQQVSHLSGKYNTYQPYLNNLIKIIHGYQPHAAIGWQMTWAYSSTSTHSGFIYYEYNQTVMYEAILNAVNQMRLETDISLIIPTGVVIQELRGTSICNDLELTRDGYHLDYGAGRYAAACTWFETLIRPVFHIGVKGNTLRANAGNVPVTDDVALLCQEVTENVVRNYYGN